MRRSWLSRMSPCEFHDTPRVVTRVNQRRERAVEQIAAVLRRILLRADEARDNLPAYTVYPVKVDDLAVVLVCAAVIILSLVIQEDIAILDVFRLKLELHRTLLELGEGEVGLRNQVIAYRTVRHVKFPRHRINSIVCTGVGTAVGQYILYVQGGCPKDK